MLEDIFRRIKRASKSLANMDDALRNRLLCLVADAIEKETETLLAANREDLALMNKSNPMYDRLQLTPARLKEIADNMRHVPTLPSPLGKVLKHKTLPNGLNLRRVSVPFGVIGVVYEARPNVTFDVFALCLKSGNASILKCGKDAIRSCQAGVDLIHRVLKSVHVNPDIVALLPATHEATAALLQAVGYVDLCIPRGGKHLISFVRDTAKVPVIETGAGVVHAYFDKDDTVNLLLDHNVAATVNSPEYVWWEFNALLSKYDGISYSMLSITDVEKITGFVMGEYTNSEIHGASWLYDNGGNYWLWFSDSNKHWAILDSSVTYFLPVESVSTPSYSGRPTITVKKSLLK